MELVAFMGLTENMRVQDLRKMAGGVKYIIPKFAEELQDFTTEVSKYSNFSEKRDHIEYFN